jgi:SEC-C motif
MDPLAPFSDNEPCWCGSQRRYGACHGLVMTSEPGAPVRADDGEGIWIAPLTRLSREAINSMTQTAAGVPISMPSPEPAQRAPLVHPVAVTLADLPRRQPTVPLGEIGRLRFEMLTALGLADPERLADRVAQLSGQDFDDLAYGVLDLAKASVDRLLEQAAGRTAPVVLWAEHDTPTEVIGRTLLWADHFLVPDILADALLRSHVRPGDIEQGLRELLALRPLVELGVVVPVPEDLATVLSAPTTQRATEADLRRPDLVSWVDKQLLVEGPTAREALIIGARDDVNPAGDIIYFHAHVDPDSLDDETRTFRTRLLTPYRSDFNYGPWVAQSRRQAVAQLIQEVNRSVSVAETFGGHAITRAPFRARLLRRKDVQLDRASALVWADVPWLPDASPRDLAAVASEDAAVEALRAHTRRALDRARGGDLAVAAEDVAGELDNAARELEHEIRTTRSWALMRPAPFLAVTVGLGATTGPVGAIGALAGAVGSVLPAIGQLREQRRRPAYALVMAKRRQDDQQRITL